MIHNNEPNFLHEADELFVFSFASFSEVFERFDVAEDLQICEAYVRGYGEAAFYQPGVLAEGDADTETEITDVFPNYIPARDACAAHSLPERAPLPAVRPGERTPRARAVQEVYIGSPTPTKSPTFGSSLFSPIGFQKIRGPPRTRGRLQR